MHETIYSFSIVEPDIFVLCFGIILLLSAIMSLILAIADRDTNNFKGIPIIAAVCLLVFAIAALDSSLHKEENYSIMKLETFSDFEKVSKENQSIQMIDNNIFLVKLKR